MGRVSITVTVPLFPSGTVTTSWYVTVSPIVREAPLVMDLARVRARVARVKPGRIMFELGGVPEALAKEALERAIQKLPIKAKFVTRAGESI